MRCVNEYFLLDGIQDIPGRLGAMSDLVDSLQVDDQELLGAQGKMAFSGETWIS